MLLSLWLLPMTSFAFADHIFENNAAFGQYLDVAQLTSPKYVLEINDNSYDVYYGFHGSLEVDIGKLDESLPIVSSMAINSERKSLEINFSEVPQDSVFWVRIPFNVMTAEHENYQLLIDGKETRYDSTNFPSDYAIGMIIPKDSEHIEIIGTKVVPEFGIFTILILGISILGLIYLVQKSPFTRTRIN